MDKVISFVKIIDAVIGQLLRETVICSSEKLFFMDFINHLLYFLRLKKKYLLKMLILLFFQFELTINFEEC